MAMGFADNRQAAALADNSYDLRCDVVGVSI
jgi:hypothetical protein